MKGERQPQEPWHFRGGRRGVKDVERVTRWDKAEVQRPGQWRGGWRVSIGVRWCRVQHRRAIRVLPPHATGNVGICGPGRPATAQDTFTKLEL